MPAQPRQTATRYAADAQKAAAALRREKKEIADVSPKTKRAIEFMVFEGMKRPDAAQAAEMNDDSLRQALRKPNTLAYLNECTEVLRAGLRPRALHTMGELLDAKNESTKFKAAEYLDGQNRGQHTIGAAQVNVQINQTVNVERAGYVIDLREDGAQVIEHAPQITHLEQDEDK